MPQATNLSIQDGQASPATVVFAVEQATPALSSFADRSAGVACGFRRIRIANKFATGKSKINRARLTIEVPKVSAVNGVSAVAYYLMANVELVIPDQASDADRKDLFAFVKNALANTSVTASLRDLDPFY